MRETNIVTCRPGCKGETKPCIEDIKEIVESGDTAFMIYTQHIIDDVKKLGYTVETVMGGLNKDIPVGMSIFKDNKRTCAVKLHLIK